MPIYDYICPNGHRFEVIHGVTASGPDACPVCGASPVRKAIAAPAIHFKGSGWAKKDRGSAARKTAVDSESTPAAASVEGASSDAGSSSGSSTKSSTGASTPGASATGSGGSSSSGSSKSSGGAAPAASAKDSS